MKSNSNLLPRPLRGIIPPMVTPLLDRDTLDAAGLERAAHSFEAESAVLARCRKLIGWSAPEGPDPERNREASALLAEARNHYASGIAALEQALVPTDR